tara:strand:+ start:36 stop:419 length:384 start_codon:yes stop_codon:yes gene_type:complete
MLQKEFYSAFMSYDEKNLITVRFKDGIDINKEEISLLVNWSLEVVENKPFYLLVDARDILSSMDHESRKFFAEHKEYNQLNIAQAIVVNNMPIRLIAMAYYKLYKHSNPIQVFKDIEEAKLWLFSHG